MQFLFPQDPLNPKEADRPFKEEYLTLKEEFGKTCSLFDFDNFRLTQEVNLQYPLNPEEPVLYRGWMLKAHEYFSFRRSLLNLGLQLMTSFDAYQGCHWLPHWYNEVREYTPESYWFSGDYRESWIQSLLEKTKNKGWHRWFVKDYVKSNNDQMGSIAKSPEEVKAIAERINLYRDGLEGGLVLRQVEDLIPDSEERYFVLDGIAYSRDGQTPDMVNEIAERIDSPFFSIDTAMRQDGTLRLIELGDGQVSTRKKWDLHMFCYLLTFFDRRIIELRRAIN